MDIKKVALQVLNLKGELKDFIYIAPIVPATSSFFVSFGLGLLESLIRLKSSDLEIEAWERIVDWFPAMLELSKKFQLLAIYDNFVKLYSSLKASSRKNAMQIMLELEQNEKLCIIDIGFRLLIVAITNNYLILKGKVRNFEVILNSLVQKLKISVFCIVNGRHRVYKTSEGVPVVCLYSNSGNFSILYHRATKYVDEKPDPVHFDPHKFPFANSNLPQQEITQTSSALIDLVNFLSSQIPTLSSELQLELQSKLSNLPEEFSGINSLSSVSNLLDRQSCNHNGNFVLGNCGKLHCSECMRYWTRCPCGSNTLTPSFRSGGSRIRSTSTNRVQRDVDKFICLECRKTFEVNAFNLISCKSHFICYKCRGKKILKGKFSCPTCTREYTPEEKNFLLAISNTLNN